MSDRLRSRDALRNALQWLVEAHQNDEPLGRAMDHASSVLDDDAMQDMTSRDVIERCAAVCFARAEEQSTLQKRAYDEGRNKAGEGHWRAQCELLEAAYAIAALRLPPQHSANQDVNNVDFRASIADELESAANCGLPPDPGSGTRFERRLRFAINDAVTALRQRGAS